VAGGDDGIARPPRTVILETRIDESKVPVGGQPFRDGRADTARRAGDERDFLRTFFLSRRAGGCGIFDFPIHGNLK
jgi:hypothetical protein